MGGAADPGRPRGEARSGLGVALQGLDELLGLRDATTAAPSPDDNNNYAPPGPDAPQRVQLRMGVSYSGDEMLCDGVPSSCVCRVAYYSTRPPSAKGVLGGQGQGWS